VWLLHECKARVLESAIKEQAKRLHGFFSEECKWFDLFPEGSDAQSLLHSLPPFAVLRGNIARLQLEMDKARRVRTSDKKSVWLKLDLDLQLFLDPFAAVSARKSKVVAMNKVTVLNHMVATARQITLVRELALTGVGADALRPVFATIFQGPRGRGAARDGRGSVGPAIIVRHLELE